MRQAMDSNSRYSITTPITKCKHLSFYSGKTARLGRSVSNIHQRVEQDHFSLHYNSLLFPHIDVSLTLT